MGEPTKPPCCVLKDHMAAVGKGFPFEQQLSAHMCGLVDLILDNCGNDPDRVGAIYQQIGEGFYNHLFTEFRKRHTTDG